MLPGQTLRRTISLSGAATGTPTAKLLHNGVQDTTVTPTVVAGADANSWFISAAIPSSGYAAGDTIEFSLTATVSGVTASLACAGTTIDNAVTLISGQSVASVTGSVGSVTAGVTVATNNDKTGYALSTAGVTAVQSGLATSGQIPANFTSACFASTGVFSTAALANAPTGSGGASPFTPAQISAVVTPAVIAAMATATVGNVAGPVASVTSPVTVGAVNDKSGYALAAAGLDAVAVEPGVNARQALSPILAACAGAVAGAGTGVVVIKGGNSPTTRITATTDNAGNRSSVTLTLPS